MTQKSQRGNRITAYHILNTKTRTYHLLNIINPRKIEIRSPRPPSGPHPWFKWGFTSCEYVFKPYISHSLFSLIVLFKKRKKRKKDRNFSSYSRIMASLSTPANEIEILQFASFLFLSSHCSQVKAF